MPAPTPPSFSYATAAQLLRSSRATAQQKIEVARDLLTRKLWPSPTSLILDHIFYALKSSTSIPQPSLAHYWQLLHDTLQTAARQSEHIPELPDSLIEHAAAHILHPACTKAVAQALFTLLNYPLPQSLQAYGNLLQNIASLLPQNAYLHTLAVSVLRAYQQIQRHHHDHKGMISACIPLLQPFLSSPELRKHAAPVFRHAFFAEPNVPRDALISFLTESTCEHLPTISTFLLTAYTEAEHNRIQLLHNDLNTLATRKSSSHLKRTRQLVEKPHVLRFFQDMLCALSLNLVNQQSICLPRVRSLSATFVTACDLQVYRPSMEDLSGIQSGKRSKKNNHTFGVHTVATHIRKAFELVVTLIQQLDTEQTERSHAEALFEAAVAIVKLSVDTVENLVPMLLHACSAGLYVDGRCKLFSELIDIYARTRTVPKLLSHFRQSGRSVLGLYESVFEHDHVLHKLALTISRLPRGQAQECITIIAGGELMADEIEVVTFLSSLVLESSADPKDQLIKCVCDSVVRKIVSCKESTQSRCALLFVLSSLIFSLLTAGFAEDASTIESCMNSGILQSVSAFPFGIDDVDDFGNKFVCMLEKQGAKHACETYCTLRLLAALIHHGVRAERTDEDHSIIRRLMNMVFERFEQLETAEDEGDERLSLFYNSVRFDKLVAVVVSVMDIMELVMADEAPPGLIRFLALLVERENDYAVLWMDMLEKKVVQNCFAKVVLFTLAGKQESVRTEKQLLCALRLILQTPRRYLTKSEERRVAKAVVRLFPSLRDDVTRAKALEVVLQFWSVSGSKLARVVEECAVRGVSDRILARLSEGVDEAGRMAEKAEARKGSKKLVAIAESVVERWCGEDDTQLKGGLAFLRNVDVLLRGANVRSKIVRLALKRLATAVGRMSSDCRRLLAANEQERVCEALASVCVVLRVWDGLCQNGSATGKSGRRAIESCTALLRNNVELAFGRSVGWLTQRREVEVGHDTVGACRELLKCCCQYVAGRQEQVSGAMKSGLLLVHAQVASAWHLLLDEDATVRTVGVEMMSAMCSYESEAVVDMIGTSVWRALEREAGRRAEYAREGDNDDLVEALGRVRGQSMAAAAVLCGARAPCEKSTLVLDSEGRLTGFVQVRQRRELSGVRLSRDVSGRMVEQLMEAGEWAVRAVQGIGTSGTRAMREAALATVLLALAAVETAVARRAPRRLPAHVVQTVVAWLSAVMRYDGDDAGRVVARATHVCRHLLRAHSRTLRWGCGGVLRHATRRAGALDVCDGAMAAEPLRHALVELAAGGDGAVNAAVGGECCHALTLTRSGALRRDALHGVAALLGGTGGGGGDGVRRALPLAHGDGGAAAGQVARAALALQRAARYRGR